MAHSRGGVGASGHQVVDVDVVGGHLQQVLDQLAVGNSAHVSGGGPCMRECDKSPAVGGREGGPLPPRRALLQRFPRASPQSYSAHAVPSARSTPAGRRASCLAVAGGSGEAALGAGRVRDTLPGPFPTSHNVLPTLPIYPPPFPTPPSIPAHALASCRGISLAALGLLRLWSVADGAGVLVFGARVPSSIVSVVVILILRAAVPKEAPLAPHAIALALAPFLGLWGTPPLTSL